MCTVESCDVLKFDDLLTKPVYCGTWFVMFSHVSFLTFLHWIFQPFLRSLLISSFHYKRNPAGLFSISLSTHIISERETFINRTTINKKEQCLFSCYYLWTHVSADEATIRLKHKNKKIYTHSLDLNRTLKLSQFLLLCDYPDLGGNGFGNRILYNYIYWIKRLKEYFQYEINTSF
jgi:hypothetical protein